MDKQKQIEEMAKIMCGNDCEECAKESAEFHKQTLEEARNNKCLLKNCAKTLYNAGYRKVPEDSAVVNKNAKRQLVSKIKEMSFPEDDCGWDCVYISELVDLLKEFDLVVESEVEE